MQKTWVLFLLILFCGCGSPKALFEPETISYKAPATVHFRNTSGNADSFEWSCSNGQSSDVQHAACYFRHSGRYQIRLIASKGKIKDTCSREIIVWPPDDCLVELETSKGTILVRLFNETPRHRDNFLKLAESGFYEDQLFHRVVNGFMIQAGDPESKKAGPDVRLGSGGPGYTIPAEIHQQHFHTKGALAAARTGDEVNPKKESSGSQFYIVHGRPADSKELYIYEGQKNVYYDENTKEKYKKLGGAPQLDMEYTIFGEVVAGLEIIDSIASVPTDSFDRPKEDIIIRKVTVIK